MNGLETTRLLADLVDQTHDCAPLPFSSADAAGKRMRPGASMSNIKSSCWYNFRIWGHADIIPADHTTRLGGRRGDRCPSSWQKAAARGDSGRLLDVMICTCRVDPRMEWLIHNVGKTLLQRHGKGRRLPPPTPRKPTRTRRRISWFPPPDSRRLPRAGTCPPPARRSRCRPRKLISRSVVRSPGLIYLARLRGGPC